MTRAFLLLALAAMTAASACDRAGSGGESIRPFAYTSRVGWLDGHCMAIADANLARGTPVTIVSFDDAMSLTDGEIMAPTTSSDECRPLLEGRRDVNQESGVTFYRIAVREGASPGLGIGVVDVRGRLARADGGVRGDLDGDGRPEQFTQCATAEGIKFGIWEGVPYAGPALWEGYYYLDYDQEADCPQ